MPRWIGKGTGRPPLRALMAFAIVILIAIAALSTSSSFLAVQRSEAGAFQKPAANVVSVPAFNIFAAGRPALANGIRELRNHLEEIGRVKDARVSEINDAKKLINQTLKEQQAKAARPKDYPDVPGVVATIAATGRRLAGNPSRGP